MGFVPVMWSVWGVLVLVFLLLKIYVGRLNRDESDQIVLDPVFEHVKLENDQMAAKSRKIEGVSKIVTWVLIAMSLCVVGYYIMDIINQFKD